MQSLTRTSTTGVSYTPQQVVNLFTDATFRRVRQWRFAHLRKWGDAFFYVSDFTPWVTGATITHDSTQAVKRTLSLTMAEKAADQTRDVYNNVIAFPQIDYFLDIIQPIYRLGDPTQSGYIEFSLGCFFFTKPEVLLSGYVVERQLALSDLTWWVERNQATSPTNPGTNATVLQAGYTLPLVIGAGLNMMDVVYHLLHNTPGQRDISDPGLNGFPGVGLSSVFLGPELGNGSNGASLNGGAFVNATLPTQYTLNPGQSYSEPINSFLRAMSMSQLWADEGDPCKPGDYLDGTTGRALPRLRSTPWPTDINYNANSVYPCYLYNTQTAIDGTPVAQTLSVKDRIDATAAATSLTVGHSSVLPGTSDSFDLTQSANVVTITVEDALSDTYIETVSNVNSASPSSLANTGWRVGRYLTESNIPGIFTTTTQFIRNIALYELTETFGAVETLTLLTSVQPAHQDRDVLAINLYAPYVASSGTDAHMQTNVITIGDPVGTSGPQLAGLSISEKFLELGWSITIQLPAPGSGNDQTQQGITLGIDSRASGPSSSMSHTLLRVSNLTPDNHVSIASQAGKPQH